MHWRYQREMQLLEKLIKGKWEEAGASVINNKVPSKTKTKV